jgi:hypothetical protein
MIEVVLDRALMAVKEAFTEVYRNGKPKPKWLEAVDHNILSEYCRLLSELGWPTKHSTDSTTRTALVNLYKESLLR